ncbi:MAG: choloylglycine hydrolase [Anaerotignum sp.]|nr:choloylglycine hydrolase [Anaerotignum sp.]
MCTAVVYKNRYFGRNLDYECSFGEEVVLTERDFLFFFPEQKIMRKHHAILGMAHVAEGYPLYYDGMNEKGVAMAGLLFTGNAVYNAPVEGKDNIPSWALIPWVLGQCDSAAEAKELLKNLNITDEAFSEEFPPSPLHWMITDGKYTLTVEQTAEGLQVYENAVGVLTNNPPFPFHLENLTQYLHLSSDAPKRHFLQELVPFSRGMGAVGLPGDWSSASRFVRAAFIVQNAILEKADNFMQFFHILSSAEVPKGCVQLEDGCCVYTIYSSCCDLKRGIYYYKIYDENLVTKGAIFPENLDGTGLQRLQIMQNANPSHAK